MDPPRSPLGTSRTTPVIVRFGINASNGAECTPRELQGSVLRPFLGPRNSSSERVTKCCTFGCSPNRLAL
eukprot:7349769-Alexandrium_andersonii.AAC.1